MTRSAQGGRLLALAVAGLLTASLTPGGPAHAQFAAIKPGAKAPTWQSLPDWNGVWERDGHIGWDPATPFDQPVQAPYNAEYLEKVKQERAKGPPPDPGASCIGGGMPGMMTATFPMEMQLNPRQVTIIVEGQSQPRRLYTDGRGHPAQPFPQANGHSIAEWRNGQLHVDTCCLRSNVRIPGGGLHSDALTIKERFWTADPNTMKLEVTIEDPKAFTKPWTVTKTYRRRPDWEPVEYNCLENNRNPLGADGVAQVILAGDDGFNPPPSSALAQAATGPALRPAVQPGGPFGREQMQRATAAALGNMAWEGVAVAESRQEGGTWRWTVTTPTGKWRCNAQADGKNPYCER